MKSRSISLFAFFCSIAATTAMFVMLDDTSRPRTLSRETAYAAVHVRAIPDQGVVLGETYKVQQNKKEPQSVETKINEPAFRASGSQPAPAPIRKEKDPMPDLVSNYDPSISKIFSNSTGVVRIAVPAGAMPHDAFVRVIESYDHDISLNPGWTRVNKVREFQTMSVTREPIQSLRFPVTVTADYHREHLGNIDEQSLTIFYWSYELQRWVGLTTTRDPETQTVHARLVTPNVRIAVFGT